MPTYQYRCTDCGRELEVVQKFSDPSLTECPTCTGSLRKVFNAVGVVFKGSGFYRTDSRTTSGTGDADGADGAKAGQKQEVGAATNGSKDGATKDGAHKDGAQKDGKANGTKDAGTPATKPAGSNSSGGATAAKAAAAS